MTQLQPTAKVTYIENHLASLLREGHWRVGDRLPSEAELANHYGVCKLTLKKALRSLSQKGLIISRQGRGHFVGMRETRTKTWTIGYMVHYQRHLDHPVNMRRLAGFQAGLLGTPYQIKTLVQYDKHEAPVGEPPLPPNPFELPFDPASLDALVTHTEALSLEALRRLAREVPLCSDDWFEPGRRLSHVYLDFLATAVIVIGRFLRYGHRRIAFSLSRGTAHATRNDKHDPADLVRMARPDDDFSVDFFPLGPEDTPEAGAETARRMAALPADRRPTALYTSGDAFMGFREEWVTKGLSIPGDLSVVALDSLSGDPSLERLSRVRMDYRRLGEEMARELLRLLDDPDAPGREMKLTPEWLPGESLAPPPGA